MSALALAASGAVAARAEAAVVTGGVAHTCALIFDGSVRCWGANIAGETGAGPTPDKPSRSPVTVRRIHNAISVTAGAGFACALLHSGTVDCWGGDNSRQLGDAGTLYRGVAPVPGVRHAIAISAGLNHACALRSDGTVLCWGSNEHGQLGIGGVPHTYGGVTGPMGPVQVSGLHTAIAISAGVFQTCALLSGGTVDCWGSYYDGQLDASGYVIDERVVPTPVPGVSDAVAVSAGDFHACALIAGGTVKCWGISAGGALGDGTIATRYSAPVNVIGVAHATAVEVGGSACALIADGSLYCWGNNARGQLGVGTTTSQYATAVPVHGVRDAVSIGVGTNHSCAALATGNIKCWGENLWAQLGRGTVSLAGTTPVLVRGLDGSVASAFRSCGTVRAGAAFRLFAAGRASCTQARGVFRRYHAMRARRRVQGWRCATSGRSVRCRRGGAAAAPAAQVGWTRA